MNNSKTPQNLPKAKIYGKLTRNYVSFEEIDPTKNYDEHDIVEFQNGLLFGIVHEN